MFEFPIILLDPFQINLKKECFQEMGKSNIASKIRQWTVESEGLSLLVENTVEKTDQSTLNISNKVSELVHQVNKTITKKQNMFQ